MNAENCIHFGKDAGNIARENAKKGQEWIFWQNTKGTKFAAKLTAQTIKKAMLSIGTQGVFILYSRNTYAELVHWNQAVMWHRKLSKGTYV